MQTITICPKSEIGGHLFGEHISKMSWRLNMFKFIGALTMLCNQMLYKTALSKYLANEIAIFIYDHICRSNVKQSLMQNGT